jgi:hypothetical protein
VARAEARPWCRASGAAAPAHGAKGPLAAVAYVWFGPGFGREHEQPRGGLDRRLSKRESFLRLIEALFHPLPLPCSLLIHPLCTIDNYHRRPPPVSSSAQHTTSLPQTFILIHPFHAAAINDQDYTDSLLTCSSRSGGKHEVRRVAPSQIYSF